MAVRKGNGTKTPAKNTAESAQGGRGKKSSAGGAKSKSWVILFWLAFVIFIFGLFLFNREAIMNSVQAVRDESGGREKLSEDVPVPVAELSSGAESDSPPEISVNVSPPAVQPDSAPVEKPVQPAAPEPPPASRPAPVSEPSSSKPEAVPPPALPQSLDPKPPQITEQSPARQIPPAVQRPVELKERALYFTQVDRDGSILRVKVTRPLPDSDSPMTDAVGALIAGPDQDEKQRGLISLIPSDTRILSATVRGETAYISFSEDFQYNNYGVEGYAGQLIQVVFTVTEFTNVRDVQILIEGRRVDYLGEGIWIGSPINREML